MNTILVPTDFSENAANALNYASKLAQVVNGKIILFHNADVNINYTGSNIFAAGDIGLGATPLYPGALLPNPELEQAQQDKLDNLAGKLRETAQNFTVETIYKHGSLTSNLDDITHQQKVDLIVMGTQGASSFLDRFIGTNTASVIKETHGLPVLAVPAGARFGVPRQIAYAADLEEEGDIFLQQLITFAEPFGSEITLVHIKSADQVDIINEEVILQELSTQFPNHHLRLIERTGETVAKGLENFIQENSTDLLAIGIHERGFWDSLFHTSISEQLIFHTTIPLLALPEKPILRS